MNILRVISWMCSRNADKDRLTINIGSCVVTMVQTFALKL